jgi:hypothetical protein
MVDEDLLLGLVNLGLVPHTMDSGAPKDDDAYGDGMFMPTDASISAVANIIETFKLYDKPSFTSIVELKSFLLDPANLIDPPTAPRLIALANWFVYNKPPPRSMEEIVESKKKRQSSGKSPVQVKALEMPTFSGEFFDWAAWKEGAEIYFQAAGLYDVLTSRVYADANGKENKMVFALILKELAKTGVAFNCWDDLGDSVKGSGDGHGAWKRLVEYFERPELIKYLLDTEKAKLDALVLTKDVEMKDFMEGFREGMRRIKLYEYTLLKSGSSKPRTEDWKEKFLDKIKDQRYHTTKKLAQENREMDLQGVFIAFNVTALEFSMSTGGGAKKTSTAKPSGEKDKGNSKKQGATKGEAKGDSPAASKDKQQQNKSPGQVYSDLRNKLYRAAGDDDAKKAMLKELLQATSQEYKSSQEGRKPFGKKKRKREGSSETESRRRRTKKAQATAKATSDDEVSIDQSLADLFG